MSDVHAASNRTIDDEYGDSVTGDLPIYASSAHVGWNAGPQGCAQCALVPDTDKLFRGTWHDNTLKTSVVGNNSITLSFTGMASHTVWCGIDILSISRPIGTAIWVYCAVVLGGESSQITDTKIDFTMDGNQESPFTNDPTVSNATATFGYNVTVFSRAALENITHTLVMTMQPGSWIAFDWAQYT